MVSHWRYRNGQKNALDAYFWAWADGEPYVNRYSLNQVIALLNQLEAQIPNLPPFDPSKVVKEDWEIMLDEYIERLKVKHKKE